MKKQAGFTLAELIVSMGIFVLIIGAVAALFGTSLKAMVYGKNQERAYAEARNVMNDLKTTLHYANKKNTILPSLTSTSVDYGGTMIINNDPSNTNSVAYTRKISFNSAKTQLEIEWTGFYPGESSTNGTKKILFPATGHEGDSAFNTDEYRKACQDMFTDTSTIVSGIPFPIFRGTYEGKEVFNIVLPIQYAFEGGKKVEILRTRVAAEDYAEDTEESAIDMPDRLASAVSALFKANKYSLGTQGNIVRQMDSGASLGGKTLAGSTGKVIGYLQGSTAIVGEGNNPYTNNAKYEDKDNPYNSLATHSWTIQVCDAKGNVTRKPEDVTYWIIYVAKNVEDDLYYDEDSKSYINGYYNSQANWENGLKKQAELYGRYIIRENRAFIAYCAVYDVKGNRITDTDILSDTLKRLPIKTAGNYGYGYVKAQKSGDNRVINGTTWKADYTDLKGYEARIDYTSTGEEYTKETAGDSYSYPPK